MTASSGDPIEVFYDRHPYPPPLPDLDHVSAQAADPMDRRVRHHLIWPDHPMPDSSRVLVAGCGTTQAVRHALLNPAAEVVGIDVSETSIEHSRRLAQLHRTDNLTLHRLPLERVDELGGVFDHVVCTGVLHHLADPLGGLRALSGSLATGGAITLMVYAPYGRTGVYLIQDYCRRLGVTTEPADVAALVDTLREIPSEHPISRLLRNSRDLLDDDALADALLNPRDRAYSVPELLELLGDAGLRFGRWERQAPYLPDCGSISETPHGSRIAIMPEPDQYAALELFRGTIERHTVIAYSEREPDAHLLDFARPAANRWRPIRVPTAVALEEQLPPGAAAALLNRAHVDTDLVLFVDHRELELFGRIDGDRAIGLLGPGAASFVEKLFRHDLVVIDASD